MRIKEETLKKVDELKELISTFEDQRVDFWDEDECDYMWNGEEFEFGDLKIFSGCGFIYDEEVHVTSIYIKDDQLYFDANWYAYNHKGDICRDDTLDHLKPEFIVQRYWEESQENAFIESLEFFISLLKGEIELE